MVSTAYKAARAATSAAKGFGRCSSRASRENHEEFSTQADLDQLVGESSKGGKGHSNCGRNIGSIRPYDDYLKKVAKLRELWDACKVLVQSEEEGAPADAGDS